MISETYMNKENRDRRARELKADRYKVKRASFRNQLMHPMYIKDYPREISNDEKGFGNMIYKTYFNVIYIVEAE